MKLDNHYFNEKHYAGWSEEDFIKDQLPSIQDTYGSEENKIAFLKEVHKKINPEAAKPAKKEAKDK